MKEAHEPSDFNAEEFRSQFVDDSQGYPKVRTGVTPQDILTSLGFSKVAVESLPEELRAVGKTVRYAQLDRTDITVMQSADCNTVYSFGSWEGDQGSVTRFTSAADSKWTGEPINHDVSTGEFLSLVGRHEINIPQKEALPTKDGEHVEGERGSIGNRAKRISNL